MKSDQDRSHDTIEAIEKLREHFFSYAPRGPIPHMNDGDYQPRPLPLLVPHLLGMLDTPPRLIAHLAVVHDAAVEIVEGLASQFPKLKLDTDAVLFGASTHDLGKIIHPTELTGPGNEHEVDGPGILELHSVPPQLARFARTHGAWSSSSLPLEDLVVALADTVWKGQRIDDLETQVVERIAGQTSIETWQAYAELDSLLQDVASKGHARLAWQRRR